MTKNTCDNLATLIANKAGLVDIKFYVRNPHLAANADVLCCEVEELLSHIRDGKVEPFTMNDRAVAA